MRKNIRYCTKGGKLNKQLVFSLLFVIIFLIFIFVSSLNVNAVEPFGANVNDTNTSRAPADDAGSHTAQAGNVTELNVNGFSITQSWQGYFGNVTGTIMLADGSDNVMYNWSSVSPQGEIYASTNSTIQWSSIQCLNYTATGTYQTTGEQAGNISLYGKNLTTLESEFNIAIGDVDGVNETFIYGPNAGAAGHDEFFTANLNFTDGECISTRIYDSSGGGVDGVFEEVILYDPTTTSVIFTSILEQDVLGFDDKSHDFEMLVLEDGHGTDIDTTRYYFYVELE